MSKTLADEYTRVLASLYPQGALWPRDPDSDMMRHLAGQAKQYAVIEERIKRVLQEADPRSAIETFDWWEEALRLPDDCAKDATTLQERRNAVVTKYLSKGGQTKAYFEGLAADYGYDVEISEYRPFRCGMSPVTDGLYDHGDKIRFQWTVNVLGKRITHFRCGQSFVTEPLYSLTRAKDLECIFQRLKPAHTLLTFIYNDED